MPFRAILRHIGYPPAIRAGDRLSDGGLRINVTDQLFRAGSASIENRCNLLAAGGCQQQGEQQKGLYRSHRHTFLCAKLDDSRDHGEIS
jgi:hypothetical protein